MNDLNYAALAVAILASKPCTPERAFDTLYGDFIQQKNKRLPRLEERAIEAEIIQLRESGMKLQDIADIYGITRSAVHHRITRHQRKGAMSS